MVKPQITLTLTLILICGIIHIGYLLDSSPDGWEKDERWGVYSAETLWDGAYWGYVTSSFVHFDFIHLMFNLYWLYLLGEVLEKEIGAAKMALMVIVSSIVTSGFEFLISEETGLGFSGVLYCFFGFMWMTNEHFRSFKQVITRRVVQFFLIWLFVCIILTQLEILYIANAAHFSGLSVGVILGKATASRRYIIAWSMVLAFLLTASITPLFWYPHSISWVAGKAYAALEKGNNHNAVKWLTKAIEMDANDAWAYYNRGWAFMEMGKPDLAKSDFSKAYALDPSYFEEDE